MLKALIRAISDPHGPEAFRLAVKAFRARYRKTFPFHWADLDWFQDSLFWEVVDRFGEGNGFNAHRRKLLFEIAGAAARLDGDTAECGVFRGLSSYLMCMALKNSGVAAAKRHYVFDSFEGLSEPDKIDGEHWSKGDRSCDEAAVRRNLAEFDFVEFKKGWIPSRFAEVSANSFCLVHIDVDLAIPTKESLEFFFPRVNPGGIILVDDYGFSTCPGVTSVVEEFMSRHPEASLVKSPVGDGIIFKPALKVRSSVD